MSSTLAQIIFYGGFVLLLALCAAIQIWYGGYRMRNDDPVDPYESEWERKMIEQTIGDDSRAADFENFNRRPPA